jgi:hypothetical protein
MGKRENDSVLTIIAWVKGSYRMFAMNGPTSEVVRSFIRNETKMKKADHGEYLLFNHPAVLQLTSSSQPFISHPLVSSRWMFSIMKNVLWANMRKKNWNIYSLWSCRTSIALVSLRCEDGTSCTSERRIIWDSFYSVILYHTYVYIVPSSTHIHHVTFE